MPTNHPDDHEPSRDDEWLTVAQAAHIEGVSSRAIQRRAAAGKYQARRIETPKGEQWEINPATLKRTPTRQRDDKADDTDAKRDRQRDDHDSRESGNVASQQVERLEKEVEFLRGLVEQHQRGEAELRAALREALRAMPKQLTEGTPTAPESPRTPETLPAVVSPVEREKAPQIGSNRGEGLRQMRGGIRQMLGMRK
jgi:flagellar biosynthesis GTPase FlhF